MQGLAGCDRPYQARVDVWVAKMRAAIAGADTPVARGWAAPLASMGGP